MLSTRILGKRSDFDDAAHSFKNLRNVEIVFRKYLLAWYSTLFLICLQNISTVHFFNKQPGLNSDLFCNLTPNQRNFKQLSTKAENQTFGT